MGQKERGNKDPRVQATGAMWGITVAIVGCSIPLARIVGGEAIVLPMLAMIAAGVATGFVWKSKTPVAGNISGEQTEQIEMMKQTILELHEHVDSLERRMEEQALQIRINQSAGNIGGASASAAPSAASGGKFEPPPIVTSRKGSSPSATETP